MYPVLLDNDYILVKKEPTKNLIPGNILVYKSNQVDYIIHRLIKIKNNNFYLKGNGYHSGIEMIQPDKVIGKAVKIISGNKEKSITRFFELFYWKKTEIKIFIKKFIFMKK